MVVSFSTLGLTFQVDELVNGDDLVSSDLSNVTDGVKQALVPLQNFLLAETEVSITLLSTSSPKVAQSKMDQGAYVGLNRRTLIAKLVEWEDARLGMRSVMDEIVVQFDVLKVVLQEREDLWASALKSQVQEVTRLQDMLNELLAELSTKAKEEEMQKALAAREKATLLEALERAHSKLATISAEVVNGSLGTDFTAPDAMDSGSPDVVGADASDEMQPSMDQSDIQGILTNCTTVQCAIGRITELSFAFCWTMLTDPLSLTMGVWDKAKWFFTTYFAILSIILGGLVSFVCSNFIVYFFRQFQSVCAGIVAFFTFLRNLPTIDLVVGACRWILGRLVQVSKDTKEEREKREKEEKTIAKLQESVLKLSTALDVIDKGAEKTRKKTMEELGEWRKQLEEKLERQPFTGPSGSGGAGSGPRVVPFQAAGRGGGRGGGQKRDTRWSWRNPGQGSQGPQVQQVQPAPQDQGGPSEPPKPATTSSSSDGQEAKVTNVQASDNENTQLLYTPALVNGFRLSRCLVDTGSEVNLLPKNVVVKYGFTVNKAGIKALLDFHGGSSAVDGNTVLDLQIGPTTMKGCEFLISPAISVPIIGMPALQALGMRVDCAVGELVEKTTGATVKCSVVEKQKN